MQLYGQYDSPFVRRVGVTLQLYDLPYEHVPWSVWGDAERLASLNPLRRVPVLVLDDGTVLTDSFVIVDVVDDLVGEARALLPRSGPVRREGLRLTALASGFADKAVALLYEGLVREVASPRWIERCRTQLADTLVRVEADLASREGPFFLGAAPSHPDILWTCALRFAREAHPSLFEPLHLPALDALAARCEAMPAFADAVLPITNVL